MKKPYDIDGLVAKTLAECSKDGPDMEAVRKAHEEIEAKRALHQRALSLAKALKTAEDEHALFVKNFEEMFSPENREHDRIKLMNSIRGGRPDTWDLAAVYLAYDAMGKAKADILRTNREMVVAPVENAIVEFAKENSLQA